LVEYKQEAYAMFVDLMHDIYTTFAERFLRVQVIYNPPEEMPPDAGNGARRPAGPRGPQPSKRRFNALGVAEDEVPPEPPTLDSGPAEGPPSGKVVTKPEPVVVGAGRAHALSSTGGATAATAAADWANVGRNDPCPCGSGKKYKKCHGATG
jgi:preprotein translocase subunit SecA